MSQLKECPVDTQNGAVSSKTSTQLPTFDSAKLERLFEINHNRRFVQVSRFIDFSVPLTAVTENGDNILHLAIKHMDFKTMHLLVNHKDRIKLDLNSVNADGLTAYRLAIQQRCFRLGQLLIQKGAKPVLKPCVFDGENGIPKEFVKLGKLIQNSVNGRGCFNCGMKIGMFGNREKCNRCHHVFCGHCLLRNIPEDYDAISTTSESTVLPQLQAKGKRALLLCEHCYVVKLQKLYPHIPVDALAALLLENNHCIARVIEQFENLDHSKDVHQALRRHQSNEYAVQLDNLSEMFPMLSRVRAEAVFRLHNLNIAGASNYMLQHTSKNDLHAIDEDAICVEMQEVDPSAKEEGEGSHSRSPALSTVPHSVSISENMKKYNMDVSLLHMQFPYVSEAVLAEMLYCRDGQVDVVARALTSAPEISSVAMGPRSSPPPSPHLTHNTPPPSGPSSVSVGEADGKDNAETGSESGGGAQKGTPPTALYPSSPSSTSSSAGTVADQSGSTALALPSPAPPMGFLEDPDSEAKTMQLALAIHSAETMKIERGKGLMAKLAEVQNDRYDIVYDTRRKYYAYFSLAAALVQFFLLISTIAYGGISPLKDNPMLGPDVDTLIQFGGNSPTLIREGEFWRIFTASWLHAGVFHFAMNVAVLGIIGRKLERWWGWAAYILVYLAAGIVGNIASAAFLRSVTVAVGASGSLMGILGAMVTDNIVNYHHMRRARLQLIYWVVSLAIYVLFGYIPLIDNMQHVVGLFTGAFTAGIVIPIIGPHSLKKLLLTRFLGVFFTLLLTVPLCMVLFAYPDSTCTFCCQLVGHMDC